MSSISAIGAYSQAAASQPVKRVDRDNDGDNDAGQSKAAEAAETSRGPAATVTLSPQAKALMASQV